MEHIKQATDLISVSTVAATLAGWLPNLAALFTVVWTGFRLWEMVSGRPFSETRLARWVVSKLSSRRKQPNVG